MNQGEAVEFDHPHNLLQNPSGYFTSMVQGTGMELEKILRRVAEENYKNLSTNSFDRNTHS